MLSLWAAVFFECLCITAGVHAPTDTLAGAPVLGQVPDRYQGNAAKRMEKHREELKMPYFCLK